MVSLLRRQTLPVAISLSGLLTLPLPTLAQTTAEKKLQAKAGERVAWGKATRGASGQDRALALFGDKPGFLQTKEEKSCLVSLG